MARVDHLPIYRQTIELQQEYVEARRHMPRDVKFSLGAKVSDMIVNVLTLIVRANNRPPSKRVGVIERMREELAVISVLIRNAALDLKVIPRKRYDSMCQLLGSMQRQTEGWLKSLPA